MDLEQVNLNKIRLQDEARKLLTELKMKHSFCNFYDFQQAVKHFGSFMICMTFEPRHHP